MRNFLILVSFLILFCNSVFASSARFVNADFLTTGAFTLTVPGITDTIVTLTGSGTLTGKSMSGSSNTFTNISLTSSVTGVLPTANGGLGAGSFPSNGILYGNGASTLQVTAAGSQFQSLQAGSGGTPAFDAIHLSQAAAVTGQLGISNGGTGQSTASGAINALLPSQTGQSGNFLTTNGTVASWGAVVSAAPVFDGTSASPQAITAAGGVVLSSLAYYNIAFVVGSPGAVTVTATPSVTAGTAEGQELKIIGTDNTKTVRLQDQSNLASSGLSLNGDWIGAKDSVLSLHWDATQALWVEDSRR